MLRERNTELTEAHNAMKELESKFPRLENELRDMRNRLEVSINEKHDLERNYEQKSRQVQ